MKTSRIPVQISDRPTSGGVWFHRNTPQDAWRQVVVKDTPASGRHCKTLRMGGSAQVGWAGWSGEWTRQPLAVTRHRLHTTDPVALLR